MKKESLAESTARLARTLVQVQQALIGVGWRKDWGAGWRDNSWFMEYEPQVGPGITEALGAAREIVRALARGVALPEAIDPRELKNACMSIRHPGGFDVLEVRKVIDHAALILTDREMHNQPRASGPTESKTIPPCPTGIGEDTHARLWKALPERDWFRTGDVMHTEGVRVGEKTISNWCRGLTPKYLVHNGKRGKASRYRHRQD